MNVLFKTKQLQSCIVRKLFSTNTKITPVQGQIIEYLAKGPVYQKDIEAFLKIRRSTISGILHTMEKNDLIIKTSIETDYRLKKISLTDKALNLHQEIDLKFKSLNEEICKNIDQKDLDIFLSVIDKMINNIEG
jgi:DNA-binding MarR family transcriptional regulator